MWKYAHIEICTHRNLLHIPYISYYIFKVKVKVHGIGTFTLHYYGVMNE